MTTSDEGFREIQLNGKQLVFLFMAVTVVSVVIFLCGVLVGRGVQARPAVAAEATTAPEEDATADVATPAPTEPLEPTKADGLGYPERLEANGPVAENLVTRPEAARPQGPTTVAPATPAPAAAAAASAAADKTPPRPAPTEQAKSAQPAAVRGTPGDKAAPLPPEPKGDGMAIQVAALRGRAEADAVVARLKGKGYSAYIVPALPGQPAGFRVRVGKFKTRAEAEKVAAKLEQEEQFKPWITR